MANVTIQFTITATLPCSKRAAKAYEDEGEEEGFTKIKEKAEAFLQRLPGADSVDIDSSEVQEVNADD